MDVVYLYDGRLGLRAPIVTGVSELIHAEGDYTLSATIPDKYRATPGEYLGFRCIDGRFRLFLIDQADDVEDDGTTEITATDAAVKELTDSVAANLKLEGKTAEQAVRAIIAGTDFDLGTVTAGSETGTGEYAYIKRWTALGRVAEELDVRIVPYYIIEGARITGRRVDVLRKDRVCRGRFFERGRDATGVVVSHIGAPKTVLYGVGKVSGESETERVTIADASWSVAKGDPADKPKGQPYIEDAEAIDEWGRHEDVYEDREETKPGKLLQKTWEELQKRKQPEISAQATISDMEPARGQKHKAVRMWDWVVVETRKRGSVEAQVIAIKRDYIRPSQTKLTIGKEGGAGSGAAGLVSQIAMIRRDTSSIGARGQANSNRSIYNKHLIQLNANAIQMNAETIIAQADTIALNTTNINEMGREISGALIELDKEKQKITAMAGTLDTHGNLIDGVLVDIDGVNTSLTTKVSKDGVISAINQTPESVTIQASKINLSGYVTASQLKAEFSDFKLTLAETMNVKQLSANAFECQKMTFKTNPISLGRMELVKSVSGKATGHIAVRDANGSIIGTALTGYQVSYSTDTIYYLSWE